MNRQQELLPSTEWLEIVPPDEERRLAEYVKTFEEIQLRRGKRWGTGRALHRKQLCAAHGTLEVLDGLPAFTRYGVFAAPHDFEVWVRLSNGGMDKAADRVPDVRGFAMRVFGVQGESALGGTTDHQDFTLINQESFAFATADEFIQFVAHAVRGQRELLKYVLKRYGLLGGPRKLGKLLKVQSRPFSGFATETLYSAVPMANGPYAVRLRLLPAETNGKPTPGAREDWAADFAARLRESPLHWDLQVQYFATEESTPIEDASVSWATPYTTVARLMLPPQDLQSEEAKTLAEKVEADAIDPWHALADHRPLGNVQRARKAVYFASQKGRGAV